ncbi:hypothetical protein Godav_001023 [Gossypium davidsonii]|uniref:DUF4283 domain-containing protein n=1 Tax=Gossypium davidsonii TaxID=34287 RepID=A0A7J8T2F9_GOSDV|nr:hypothetical protein [Gossypium davidsonii]
MKNGRRRKRRSLTWMKEEPEEVLDQTDLQPKGKGKGEKKVRFQDDNEYLTAILGGLWTIFGHYLMVRPWTPGFSTDQAQPSNLMVWIRLPRLPKGMYTTSLLKFIGGTIGSVAKIDRNTDNKARGQFAHLMVFVDLGQPLVSDKDRWKDSTAKGTVPIIESDQPQRRGPRSVVAKSIGGTTAGETSCFRIFSGNLVDATGTNAQESNADDMSQTVTTQIGGVSGTTTKGVLAKTKNKVKNRVNYTNSHSTLG